MRCVQALKNKVSAVAAVVASRSTSNATKASITDYTSEGSSRGDGSENPVSKGADKKATDAHLARGLEGTEWRSVPFPLAGRKTDTDVSSEATSQAPANAPIEIESSRNGFPRTVTGIPRHESAAGVLRSPIHRQPTQEPPPAGQTPVSPQETSFFGSIMGSFLAAPFGGPPESAWDSEQAGENLIRNPYNFAAWRTVLNSRQRIEGDDGVKIVWREMRRRKVDLPVDGQDADALWTTFISTGARDSDFFGQLVRYAEQLVIRKGDGKFWPPFYDRVMEIPTSPQEFLKLHFRLLLRFQATNWGLFLTSTLRRHPDWQEVMREIYASLPQPTSSYDEIISFLCSQNEYPSAMKWHKLLCVHRDPPQGKISYTPLLRWAARHSSPHHLQTLLQTLPISEADAVQVVNSHNNPHQALAILFSTKKIPTSTFGDFFWSSLIQPLSRISKVAAVRYIILYGAGCVVGPNTLLQACRILEHGPSETVTILEDTGMIVMCSKESPGVSNVSSCHCIASGAHTGFGGTFVCTADNPRDPTAAAVANINHHLHQALQNRDVRHALQLLSHLRRTRSEITSENISLLPSVLLRIRNSGKNPSTSKRNPHPFPIGEDVDVTVALHLRLVTEGYKVPALVWRECLKRFGMSKRWTEIESLLERLVEAYPPGPAGMEEMKPIYDDTEGKQTSFLSRKGPPSLPSQDPSTPRKKPIRTASREHKEVFTAQLFRSIIEWSIIGNVPARGIGIIKDLYDRGVWIDERSLKRAVRVQTRGMQPSEVDNVRKIVKDVWGEDLWTEEDTYEEIWKTGKTGKKGSGKGRGKGKGLGQNVPSY
ncbi:hypothetical protein EX30DRAFT_5365 [Ascodesmis nigricans]|uniref:Uncharacterized protein n=1 Tax=Ascodesmis nigricans TaxID=341454 RepID=A0A4S2N647_9PEZI|nr:hypothetical protein EX30DRAFT_5365 [Ascodesmis nigricans]